MPRSGAAVHRRLQVAALELFGERGYDRATAAEIAERAGVTERTFFRHFADKREVLFAGADALHSALVGAILQAPDLAEPLPAVVGALAGYPWEDLGSRDLQRRRRALIAAHPGLLERELIKWRSLGLGIVDALRRRGVDADLAALAGGVGAQVFLIAYEGWLDADAEADLATIARGLLARLGTITPPPATPSGPAPAPASGPRPGDG